MGGFDSSLGLADVQLKINLLPFYHSHLVSLSPQMTQVCMLNLDEGKAKNWQPSLKATIAQKFIASSPELQEIIHSKKGFWSSLKGFCQWLMWVILGQ